MRVSLLNNIPQQQPLLFMEFWVWGWGASETIQACPEEQEGGGAGNGGAESSTPWPQKPADLETPPPSSYTPLQNTKEQTQPPPSCLSLSL